MVFGSQKEPMWSHTKYVVIKTYISKHVLAYCISILYGQPKYAIRRFQYVQNCAARLIYRCGKYEHVTLLFKSLHWLPIEQRIKFKTLVINFKALHGLAASYNSDLIKPYVPGRTLRSVNQSLLCQPKFNLKSFGACAYSIFSANIIKTSLHLLTYNTRQMVFYSPVYSVFKDAVNSVM